MTISRPLVSMRTYTVAFAVALSPVILQTAPSCERGDTYLLQLEFEADGINHITGFNPNDRSYDVSTTSPTAIVRAQSRDPDSTVTYQWMYGATSIESGMIGGGGGEVTVSVPFGPPTLRVSVRSPEGALDAYVVQVTGRFDGLPCTEQGIRDAIAGGGGPYTFACSGPTTVATQGEIDIDSDVILDGGRNLTVDTGTGSLTVPEGVTAEIQGLAMISGYAYNFGTLTLADSSLTVNSSQGLINLGPLTVDRSTVVGAISGAGTPVAIADSATGDVQMDRGTLTVTDSAIGGLQAISWYGDVFDIVLTNSAVTGGLGVFATGALSVTNSTIVGNASVYGAACNPGGGGGRRVAQKSEPLMTVTISSSTMQGSIELCDASLAFSSTLVDGYCTGAGYVSGGYNIESPGNTCGFDHAADLFGVAELNLGPLQDNGGPTQTLALLPSSIAIDWIPEADCGVATDQRGVTRPGGFACDVGAFELVQMGDTSLSTLEFEVDGQDQLVGFHPDGRSYDALVSRSIAILRAQPSDPASTVAYQWMDGGTVLESGTLGVGGGEATVNVPAGKPTLRVNVSAPQGGVGHYTVRAIPACEPASAEALRLCVKSLNDTTRACYVNTDAPCADNDPNIAAALTALQDTVLDVCSNGGGLLSGDALALRLAVACELESASIAARAFGGPHGAVWSATPGAVADVCLAEPHRIASQLVDAALQARDACLAYGSCDAPTIELQEQALRDQGVAEVAASCGILSDLIALEPDEFAQRTMDQVDCLTAIAYADAAPLTLRCGPSNVTRDPPPAPGFDGYMKVVLDSSEYGTRCGGGAPYYPADNPYAFQVKLAPAGEPIENVMIYFEGGGACVSDDVWPCFERYLQDPSLFEAQNSVAYKAGVMSDDETVSPFAKWTKVYLQYCTQDLHTGNGTTNQFPHGPFTVHRYGAINARAAIRYVRDLIWKVLDEQGGEGYRSDRVRVAFGGFSAGGFGVLYNYHWVLDDLQWAHATAFPDSALALDNMHDPVWRLSVQAGPAFANWNPEPNLPPYCFSQDCVVGPNLLAAHALRLEAVPEQQFMIISNQNDEYGQMEQTFFNRGTTWEQGRINWINAARQAYCDTQGLTGLNYFLMPLPETLHSTSMDDFYVSQVFVEGETMGAWLGSAFSDPDGVGDRVEEGSLTQIYATPAPGVQPFPCALE